MVAMNKLILPALSVLMLAACSGAPKGEAKYPTGADRNATAGGQNDIYSNQESIFGKGGLFSFGKKQGAESGQTGLGVNSYLWRASLDTVSFMPLSSADPFGGVILTDWYTPQETPNERFKLNVFILNRQLKSDAIQVKVFRQVRSGGNWKDAAAAEGSARQLEDAILTRARQIRVAEANGAD